MKNKSLNLRELDESDRLKNVLYEIRGRVSGIAADLEAQGHRILKLNIGNPAMFGFDAPDTILQDIIKNLPYSQGYTESKGILSARRAVVTKYEDIPGFPKCDVNDVFLGNGVSELINLVTQAAINPGDEVLIPAPDYPLWTAMTNLAGGKAVHYMCDESNDWSPDIADMESKITPKTKAIVVINPNNPTGAVYSKQVLEQIAEVARKHSLLILADEIYDRILYDGAVHHCMGAIAPDLLVFTFNGLSKTYRVAGFRAGWMIISGPRDHAKGLIHGLDILASSRLCPNAPAQHGIQVALGGNQSINDLIKPGGRFYEQKKIASEALNAIDGVSCVEPKGALYVFPKIDPNVHEIHDDMKFVEDLLLSEKILVVQGSGFNWPYTDHFRIVTLPLAADLKVAIERLGNFLSNYKQ